MLKKMGNAKLATTKADILSMLKTDSYSDRQSSSAELATECCMGAYIIWHYSL